MRTLSMSILAPLLITSVAQAATRWPTENCGTRSKQPPVLVQQADPTHRLVVCNFGSEDSVLRKRDGTVQLNAFGIYRVGKTEQERKEVYVNESELATFQVKKAPPGNL